MRFVDSKRDAELVMYKAMARLGVPPAILEDIYDPFLFASYVEGLDPYPKNAIQATHLEAAQAIGLQIVSALRQKLVMKPPTKPP